MQKANTLSKIWKTLRALTGEDRYERYLEHFLAHHAHKGEEPLTRKAFFDAELARKWNGVKRCC